MDPRCPRRAHAGIQRRQCCAHLGDHPAADRAIGDQCCDLGPRKLWGDHPADQRRQLPGALIVGPQRSADAEQVGLEPERVARLDRARRLDPAGRRDARVIEPALHDLRLVAPVRLAGPEGNRAGVGHEERVEDIDEIRVVKVMRPEMVGDEELRRRFPWIAAKRPGASRAELEELVNLYLLGRQEVAGAALACDVETREHCGCDRFGLLLRGEVAEAGQYRGRRVGDGLGEFCEQRGW